MFNLCSTPEPPKRTPRPRPHHCGLDSKRIKIDLSPFSPPYSLPSSSIASPLPSSSSTNLVADLSFLGKNFTVNSTLVEGDFGEVKEVQSKYSNDKYAIKISKVDKMKVKTGLHYTKMHLKEVRVHSSIPSHPNLVNFFRAWKEDGYVYMLLELCEISLDGHWNQQNILTQKEIHSVLRDMIMALKHLSSINCAHLDVKPGNILRCSNGVYKLADFSAAIDLNKEVSPSAEFGDALSGSLELNKIVEAMILPLPSRPSVEQLIVGETRYSIVDLNHQEKKIECTTLKRTRLSLPSSIERQFREKKSPLVKESSVIFHSDSQFFEMEKSKTTTRSAKERRRTRFI